MSRFRVGAAVLIVLACSCGREPAAPVVNLQPQAPRLVFIDFNTGFTVNLGQSLLMAPTLVDSIGIPLSMPAGLTVVSRDTNVLTIDSQTFTLHTIGTGNTRVVASVKVNGVPVSDSITVFVSCTAELNAVLTPNPKTLVVGESFTPTIVLYTCGGQLHPTDTWTWHASDTTVVRVDSVSGLTTGLRAGTATIRPTGIRFGTVGAIGVTVTPAP